MDGAAKQSFIEQYHDQGFFLVPNLLTAAEVQHFRDVIDDLIERSRSVTQHTDIYDLEPDHSAARPRLRRIKQPHRVDPVFAEFMRHPKLQAVLTAIIGPDIRHQTVKLNTKFPDGGSALEWHQDWAFYPHCNDSVLAVGLMIDDVTTENGPTLVIPGSHRPRRVFDHHQDGVFAGAMDPTRKEVDFAKAVPITGPAGSIFVFDSFIVHGAASNRSKAMRRTCFYEFVASDAWPINEINDPGVTAANGPLEGRGIAGRAIVKPRVVEVPVRMPIPRPDRPYGSIYEAQKDLANRYFS